MIRGEGLRGAFETEFGRSPRLYRAPGRVNLIGEHTDYNDGFVMPMALDRATWVAGGRRDDRKVVACSDAYREHVEIDLDGPMPARTGHWSDYLRGVAALLDRTTSLRGADLLIQSDVPRGAGLSSSAALEVACAFALLDLAGHPIDRHALARTCQQAEHEYVGTRCGLMDQFIACYGRSDQAMVLDTRSLESQWLTLPSDARIMVCNTMVKHRLASAEYNARRADCETGVRLLAGVFPQVRALRDVAPGELDLANVDMPEQVYRRCRHVVSENARVLRAADALRDGGLAAFGQLMGESHESLRRDYEVSCRELDAMVDAAHVDGVYGARMTGGGFGGSVVVLVDADAATRVAEQVQQKYEAATGLRPDIWVCAAGGGVGEWSPESAVTA